MSWSAAQYVTFEDERTRPVRDLLAALPAIEARSTIDLGCGPGNSTEVLAARFPDAAVRGVDSSPDMLAAARRRLPEVQFALGSIEGCRDADLNSVRQTI
jgi:trans-aconitate 2-methyltransferase